MKKEKEALNYAREELQARLADRDAQHASELERVRQDHSAAMRAAAESAEAASAVLRADLAEEREALFAERDAAVEKNRKYYQVGLSICLPGILVNFRKQLLVKITFTTKSISVKLKMLLKLIKIVNFLFNLCENYTKKACCHL